MNILTIVVIIFILLESSNVLALYFNPTIKQANAVGMFKTWEDSKQYPQLHNMLKYLVYWVAGTKLIFIVLLIIIFMFADNTTKIYSVGALVLSIGSFYWKLYPYCPRNG